MPEALKESLFPRSFFTKLGQSLEEQLPGAKTETFLALVYDDAWPGLELKQRMTHTAQKMAGLLPNDYLSALTILLRMADSLKDSGFAGMILSEFVALYGLDHPRESLAALERFTQIASAEFAVRPFLLRHPEVSHRQMVLWAKHGLASVRRLSTEGYRPRLPWGIGIPSLKKDPSPVLEILEILKDDPDEAVRRSVANNLNDIGKDNPEIMLGILEAWRSEAESLKAEKKANRLSLIKHALRSLIKKGEARALSLIGIEHGARVKVLEFEASPEEVRQGEEIGVAARLQSEAPEPQDLVIDFALHFVRAKGKSNRKVFKGFRKSAKPGEVFSSTFHFSFKAITTRRYYPGTHKVELLVNGESLATCEFNLL